MIPKADVYTEFSGLTQLKAEVRADAKSQKNLREVASQFESLFTKLILKGMREAKLSEGAFDSNQSDQYLDMFDSQLALHLSHGAGLGLADMLVRQLSQGTGSASGAEKLPVAVSGSVAANAAGPSPVSVDAAPLKIFRGKPPL